MLFFCQAQAQVQLKDCAEAKAPGSVLVLLLKPSARALATGIVLFTGNSVLIAKEKLLVKKKKTQNYLQKAKK